MTVVDAAGTGPVELTSTNAGEFDLEYFNTSGDSVVTDWTFHSTGNNHINHLDGAEITETITVNGSGTCHSTSVPGEDTTA